MKKVEIIEAVQCPLMSKLIPLEDCLECTKHHDTLAYEVKCGGDENENE